MPQTTSIASRLFVRTALALAVAGAAFALVLPSSAQNAARGTLNLFIWSEYIDPAVIKDFERQFNAKVNISFYESNEDMLAKLQQGGSKQYDVIVPSTYIMSVLIKQKLLAPLDKAKMPNLKNLSKKFQNPVYDPNNTHSVAYQWGMTGVGYRKDRIKTLNPSWALFFDAKAQPGPFLLLDDPRVSIGTALKFLGKPYNDITPANLKQAEKLLIDAKKRSLGFGGSPSNRDRVRAKQATMAVMYNGEAVKAMDEDPNFGFFIPKEGSEIWWDSLAIPAGAPNKTLANQFINFILDGKVGARISNYNRYASPNEAAKAFILPKDLKNPAIYPSSQVMNTLEYTQELGSAAKLYDTVWTKVKAQ
jgi:spermidine/putrescine transport system substrate-binding protein